MAEERNIPVSFENMGLYVARPGDMITPYQFSIFMNIESFRGGYLQSRRGSIEIGVEGNSSPVPFTNYVHSMGFLLQEPVGAPTSVYFGDGTELKHRTGTTITLLLLNDHVKFSGNPMVMDTYKVNNAYLPEMIIFDLNKRFRASGTVLASFGIPQPTYQATAVTGGNAGTLDGAYKWIYQYRNQNTGSIGPFSPEMDVALTVATNAPDITVHQPTDPQVTHIDLYRIGGTLSSSYKFSKTVVATTYGSPLVINDTTADTGLGVETDSSNHIEFSNILGPPTTCRKTTNNGSSYTDYTTAAADDNDATHVDLSNLDTVANGDWLVIGADYPFRKMLIGMDVAFNTTLSALSVEFWNGTSWSAVARIEDGTSVAGRTLSISGIVSWQMPMEENWVPQTIDGVMTYHIRVSASLSGSVLIDRIRLTSSPIEADVFCIHADRIWVNDLVQTDRVRYSRRIRVEEFEEDGYVIVSKGGDRVRRMVELDAQMFVFTDNTVYRLVGNSETSFQAIPTGAQHGLFARFAICKGPGFIAWRAYDGIYLIGGSGAAEKLTEDIDPLFRGIDGGPEPSVKAVYNAFNQMDHERMEYFDNKIRWSYETTDGTKFELVYDLIMKRWCQTDRQVTSYLQVNYQGRLYAAHTDKMIYHREVGDLDISGTTQEPIAIDFRHHFQNFETPQQDKNFVELCLDLDPDGATFDVTLDFNNGDYSTSYPITGLTRFLRFMPVNQGVGIFAKNCGFRITTSNQGKSLKFYKVNYNLWTEPRELNKTSWDWNDYGHAERKYLKQLVIDLDTQGASCDIFIYLDGTTTPAVTFGAVQTTTKQRKVLSLPTDTQCKIAKVLVRSRQLEWQVKAYAHYFNFLVNGLEVGKTQTDWTDQGWPADKRFRQLMVQIDTFGLEVQCGVEIDGQVVETFPIITNGRRWITHSVPANTLGKLERLVFNR